jgi:hypothetical protein
MVNNWILGRAHLRPSFSNGIRSPIPTYFRCMHMMLGLPMRHDCDSDDDGDGDGNGDGDGDGESHGTGQRWKHLDR